MRKRTLVIMLLPVTVFLWVIGWSLLWIGSQRSQNELHGTQIAAEKRVMRIAEPAWKEVSYDA